MIIKEKWDIEAEFPNISRYYAGLAKAHPHFQTERENYTESVNKLFGGQ